MYNDQLEYLVVIWVCFGGYFISLIVYILLSTCKSIHSALAVNRPDILLM